MEEERIYGNKRNSQRTMNQIDQKSIFTIDN